MKSTAGPNYLSPNNIAAQDFVDNQMSLDYPEKTKRIMSRVQSDRKKIDMIKHAANRLSGGYVEEENEEELKDASFLNALNPQKLCSTDSVSYLDFATYALFRKEKENSKGNHNDKDIAKKINEEIQKIREMMGDGESEEESEGEGDQSGNMPGGFGRKPSKNKSKEPSKDFKEIMRIYNEKLNNITYLTSRIIQDFIPEVGLNVEKLIEDIEGDERIFRQMKDIGEIERVNPIELGMPEEIFLKGAAELEYAVPIRAKGTSKKQFIYLSIDASGSMSTNCNIHPFKDFKRIDVTREICLHLVERVRKGNCEIYLRVFDDCPWPLVHAYDKESADKMDDYLKKKYHPQGGTYITHALQKAFDDLKEIKGENTLAPEILMITDGEDDIHISEIPEPYVFNYISVESYKNDGLYKLSKNFIEL